MVAAIEPPKMMMTRMFADEHVQIAAHEHHHRTDNDAEHEPNAVMISMGTPNAYANDRPLLGRETRPIRVPATRTLRRRH